MKQTFEYALISSPLDEIEIEDIGNCYIKAINNIQDEWYLSTKTELGDTYIKIFGPFNETINRFMKGFKFEFYKIDYKESRIISIIDKFINDPKKQITYVEEITLLEIEDKLDSLILKEIR